MPTRRTRAAAAGAWREGGEEGARWRAKKVEVESRRAHDGPVEYLDAANVAIDPDDWMVTIAPLLVTAMAA